MGDFVFFKRIIGSENDEIIAMDHFLPRDLLEANRLGFHIGHATRELSPVQVADTYDVAFVKLAFRSRDSRRQKTFALLAKRFFCALIDPRGKPSPRVKTNALHLQLPRCG